MSSYKRFKRRDWARLMRPVAHRVLMLRTMVTQLLQHERIQTTLAKAQALQRYADRVVTLGKRGTQQSHQQARGIVTTDRELHKLFTTVALRYHTRNGNYTRVIRTGFREGDGVPMACVEFVDRPGELRPVRPRAMNPLLPFNPSPENSHSFLPPAAREYLRQQQLEAGTSEPPQRLS